MLGEKFDICETTLLESDNGKNYDLPEDSSYEDDITVFCSDNLSENETTILTSNPVNLNELSLNIIDHQDSINIIRNTTGENIAVDVVPFTIGKDILNMKPANIMLKPDGSIRLIDFGIAREYKEGKAGDTEAIGTRGYAAPEQFGGQGQTDARTDIYSLGVTLYHLVTGKNPAEPPYEIYPIRQWNPELSSGFEWMIQKCTQLNPNDRFQSCAEISYVLENLDKFDSEYRKKQKGRIALFVVSVVMSLVFTLSSVGCFLGYNYQKDNKYNTKVASNDVVTIGEAIDIDEENPLGYSNLIDGLGNFNTVYLSDEKPTEISKEKINNKEISIGCIRTWFSGERLEKLKQNDEDTYIKVNYKLGRLFWNGYQGGSGSNLEALNESRPYFEAVMWSVYTKYNNDLNKINKDILTQQQYNLARIYYLISYFKVSEPKMERLDDGAFEVDKTAKAVGIYGIDDNSTTLSSPYLSYWMTCVNLVRMLSSDENKEMRDQLRINTLDSLANILETNYEKFKSASSANPVTIKDMKAFFEMFSKALNYLSDEKKEEKDKLTKHVNKVINMVNAAYKTDELSTI